MSKKEEPLKEEDYRLAARVAEEFGKTLPKEFILAARIARNGKTVFPDLHFKADPKITGLFHARLDSDFVMGHGRGPKDLKVREGAEPETKGERK